MKHVGLVGLIHVYNLIFNGVKWRMKRIYDQQFDTWACLKIEGCLKREYGGTLTIASIWCPVFRQTHV